MSEWNIDPETMLKIPGRVWVYWKDEQSYFLGCNDYMAEELKLSSRHDIKGKHDYELFSKKDEIKHYLTCDKLVMTSRETRQFHDTTTLPDYCRKFIAIKSPLVGPRDRIQGVVGISFFEEQAIDKTLFNQHTLTQYVRNKNFNLSPREIETAYFLVKGKTAKEIAKILNVSHRTIESHLLSIKMKLNVPNKSQLIEKIMDEFFLI